MSDWKADYMEASRKRDAEDEEYYRRGIGHRMAAATTLGEHGEWGDMVRTLGLDKESEAIGLLWQQRLISLDEASAIADRFVLMAEKAKSNLRKALA